MRHALVATVAVIAVSGTADADVLRFMCHGALGDGDATDFTISVDLFSLAITERDFRWTTTDNDTTIDWHLDRQSGALRAVILTGSAAGFMIAGKCQR